RGVGAERGQAVWARGAGGGGFGAAEREGDRRRRDRAALAADEPDDAADQFEGRFDRAHQRLAQRAAHDGDQVDAGAAALIDLDGNVQVDVAAHAAQQRQRHVQRDAELLLEQRVVLNAAEVEVVQGDGVADVVLAAAVLRRGLDLQRALADAVRRVGGRVGVERRQLEVAHPQIQLAALRSEIAGCDDLALFVAGDLDAHRLYRRVRIADVARVDLNRRIAALEHRLHGAIGEVDRPIADAE